MKMKEIANNLGISIATVSRVVNGHSNVKLETKKKVLDYIEKEGYTPNAIAQSLSKKENKTVAMLIPNITNPFFGSLVNKISKIFIKNGYQIALYNTIGDLELEEKAIKNILSQKVAAVIAILNEGEYKINPVDSLINENIPVYLLDREIIDLNLPGVFINNFSGAYNLTKELIKQGNTDICIITGNLKFFNARERLRGFETACKDMGIPCNENNIYLGDYLFDSGYQLAPKILNKSHTAVFISNNLMLYGFLKNYKNYNKKLQISCFEKTEFLDILNFDIKTGSIPLDDMATEIYNLFIKKEKNKKIYIEPTL